MRACNTARAAASAGVCPLATPRRSSPVRVSRSTASSPAPQSDGRAWNPTRSKLAMAPRPRSASRTARPTASVSPAIARLADRWPPRDNWTSKEEPPSPGGTTRSPTRSPGRGAALVVRGGQDPDLSRPLQMVDRRPCRLVTHSRVFGQRDGNDFDVSGPLVLRESDEQYSRHLTQLEFQRVVHL